MDSMKKYVALLSLFLLPSVTVQAQYYVPGAATTPKPVKVRRFDPSRLVPGGNIGFGLSRGFLYAELSPSLGYLVHERLLPGVMVTSVYMQGRFTRRDPITLRLSSENFSSFTLGISGFLRAFVTQRIFLHGEAGVFRGQQFFFDRYGYYEGMRHRTVFFPMVGGGFNFPLGSRSYLFLMALYNLNYVPNFSIYGGSPLIFRLGVAF